MASAMKPTNGTIPIGYVSPYKRVPMSGTHDDLLACAATLCNKTMEDHYRPVKSRTKSTG